MIDYAAALKEAKRRAGTDYVESDLLLICFFITGLRKGLKVRTTADAFCSCLFSFHQFEYFLTFSDVVSSKSNDSCSDRHQRASTKKRSEGLMKH